VHGIGTGRLAVGSYFLIKSTLHWDNHGAGDKPDCRADQPSANLRSIQAKRAFKI
jgi:hypothetical protein